MTHFTPCESYSTTVCESYSTTVDVAHYLADSYHVGVPRVSRRLVEYSLRGMHWLRCSADPNVRRTVYLARRDSAPRTVLRPEQGQIHQRTTDLLAPTSTSTDHWWIRVEPFTARISYRRRSFVLIGCCFLDPSSDWLYISEPKLGRTPAMLPLGRTVAGARARVVTSLFTW